MTMRINRFMALAGLILLPLLANAGQAAAAELVNFDNPAFAAVSTMRASIPVGHAEFCQTHPSECGVNANPVQAEILTEARWQDLLEVNATINAAVIPVTDRDLYQTEEFWTYPNGYGDCEDYVLAKRRALIERGWPASTLLISVVRQPNGEGHAVLMARTDRGDLVLDNQEGLIKLWNETPYRFVKRQSQADSGAWVDIFDQRPVVIASR